jgi:hypothetical protein
MPVPCELSMHTKTTLCSSRPANSAVDTGGWNMLRRSAPYHRARARRLRPHQPATACCQRTKALELRSSSSIESELRMTRGVSDRNSIVLREASDSRRPGDPESDHFRDPSDSTSARGRWRTESRRDCCGGLVSAYRTGENSRRNGPNTLRPNR